MTCCIQRLLATIPGWNAHHSWSNSGETALAATAVQIRAGSAFAAPGRSEHFGARPTAGLRRSGSPPARTVTSFLRLGPVSVLSPRWLSCRLAVTGQDEGSWSSGVGSGSQIRRTGSPCAGRNCGWGWKRPTRSRSPAPGWAGCWTVPAHTLRQLGLGAAAGRIRVFEEVTAPIIEPNQRSSPGSTVRVRTSLAQLRH